jgi:hypothetical protein
MGIEHVRLVDRTWKRQIIRIHRARRIPGSIQSLALRYLRGLTRGGQQPFHTHFSTIDNCEFAF